MSNMDVDLQGFPMPHMTSSPSPPLGSYNSPNQGGNTEALSRIYEAFSPCSLPSSFPTSPHIQYSPIASPYSKSPLPWFLRPHSPAAPDSPTYASLLSNRAAHPPETRMYRCITTVEGCDGGHTSAIAECGTFLYTAFANRKGVSVSKKPLFFQYTQFGSRYGVVSALVVTDDRVYAAHHDRIRIWYRQFRSGGVQLKHRLLTTLPTFMDSLSKLIKTYTPARLHHDDSHESNDIRAIAVGQNGLLYSTGGDKMVKVWRISKSLRSRTEIIEAHDDAVNALIVGPDGRLYTASSDKRIRIWRISAHDLEKHELVKSLEGHRMAVHTLALSSDGRTLYSGGSDLSIRVWEVEDIDRNVAATPFERAAVSLNGHRKAILSLAAVGSSLLCSGSADNTIRVWRRRRRRRRSIGGASDKDAMEYSCVSVLEGHRGAVECLCASFIDTKERCVIYSGSRDGSMKVWKVDVKGDEGRSHPSSSKATTHGMP